MPRQKDEFEMAEQEAIKAVRTAVRLKYQLMADRELNEVLPEVQERVRSALAHGRSWYLEPAVIFSDADAADAVVIEE